ncbi:MAG: 30S ribosomal protein S20 [Chloroflexota bacterium]|nr:30S ribosomal protein S20 [Chloroflexota bacterium]MDE3192856.1 30S ribosomal protein S20 [Chloroflexota bacterium]
MPKKKRSALKRIRQTRRRTAIKTLARSSARTAAKAARDAISAGTGETKDLVRKAASALDKAVKRGGLHKNAARRRKSRIARQAAKTKA